MRAFAMSKFGEPASVQELPVPEPAEGQVRVKVEASGLNPFDNAVLSGMLKDRMKHHFPLIPASDLAGTVDAVGPGAGPWKVGDSLFGMVGIMRIGEGSMAEYTTASVATIARRPASIDAEFGAALPLAAVSALQCVEPMNLKRGDVVVVIGASGGIGGFAVQMAKHAGATVVAVTRSENADYARSLGADEVIDYSKDDVAEVVHRSYPAGVAGVIDTARNPALTEKLTADVRRGGHLVSMTGGAKVEELALRGVTGINVGTKVTTESLGRVAAMVESGAVKRPRIKVFKLEDAAEAFKEIATGHTQGKLVVVP